MCSIADNSSISVADRKYDWKTNSIQKNAIEFKSLEGLRIMIEKELLYFIKFTTLWIMPNINTYSKPYYN